MVLEEGAGAEAGAKVDEQQGGQHQGCPRACVCARVYTVYASVYQEHTCRYLCVGLKL